jgi:carboxylesterase
MPLDTGVNIEPFLFQAGPVGCLLIHGFTGTPYEMRGLGEYLAERGITALGPRLAGHCTTPAEMNRTTWRDWAASAQAGLEELHVLCPTVFVSGLSLGGVLALHLAATNTNANVNVRRTSEVRRTFTSTPIAGIAPLSTPARLWDWRLIFLPVLKYLIPYTAKLPEDIHDPQANRLQPSYPVYPTFALESLLQFLGVLRGELAAVTVPTLLIHSRNDQAVPPANMPYIYEHIASPDKAMCWIENSGHVLTVDYQKETVFEKAYQFIQVGRR